MSARATGPAALAERLRRHVARRGWTGEGERLLVALSGGVDSLALLHLLRFCGAWPGAEIRAAHLDHRMREGSGRDAAWVRGLAGAWGVLLDTGVADPPPGTEAEARRRRYRFLEQARARASARWVLTAHHADDQAETVLFRALRGSGPRGLRGILEVRRPAVLRPLLPFRRAELEAYASAVGIRPRLDPTNLDEGPRRNLIRHRALPLLEQVHPGAPAALARLARVSARREEAFSALLAPLLASVLSPGEPGEAVLERDRLLELSEPLRAEVIQAAAASLGIGLSEAGTALALEFIRTGSRGGRIDLTGSTVLARDGPRFRLRRADGTSPPTAGGPGEDAPLAVEGDSDDDDA